MMREAQGYNYSIYLMAGMPYFLVGAVGFFVYRGVRRKGLAHKAALPAGQDPPTHAGSHPARGADSEG